MHNNTEMFIMLDVTGGTKTALSPTLIAVTVKKFILGQILVKSATNLTNSL